MSDSHQVISFNYDSFQLKEEGGELFSEGFVATTHPDRAKKGEYTGDILTKNAIKSVVDQINNRKDMMADLASYKHDWVKQANPQIPPVGRAVQAEYRDLPNGHAGAWVKTHHNKINPKFNDVKYELENKYITGHSIEYKNDKSTPVMLKEGKYRLIDGLDLVGYAFVDGRNIANTKAVVESLSYKEIEEAPQYKEKTESEVLKMEEQVQVKETKVDAQEYEQFRKFQEMQIKEKSDLQIKEMVQKALADLMPQIKVKSNTDNGSSLAASVQYKEWAEIGNKEISVKEAFNRATALALKTGAIEKVWRNGFGESNGIQFKATGVDCSQIQIKAALETDTNKSTDTDYLQSSAELSDVYAPAIVKMLNQRTTYFGLLPKENMSGRADIAWRAENVANTASSYLEGAAVTTDKATRQKLREVFKFYQIGVQVTGQMMESARSGIGDVFQAEVESASRSLLSTMNIALFGTSGTFAEAGFLGLEYLATSSTYTTLYGLTRSATNLLGASNSEFAAQSSAEISKPTLRTAIRTLEINGADRNDLVIVCHPLQRDKILALLDDAQRFNGTSARAGFEGQPVFDGVPLFSDKDANNDDVFVVNLGERGMRLGVQVPVRFEDLAKTDDSRRGFLKFYGNQYAIAPKQAVYMIQGLATA